MSVLGKAWWNCPTGTASFLIVKSKVARFMKRGRFSAELGHFGTVILTQPIPGKKRRNFVPDAIRGNYILLKKSKTNASNAKCDIMIGVEK